MTRFWPFEPWNTRSLCWSPSTSRFPGNRLAMSGCVIVPAAASLEARETPLPSTLPLLLSGPLILASHTYSWLHQKPGVSPTAPSWWLPNVSALPTTTSWCSESSGPSSPLTATSSCPLSTVTVVVASPIPSGGLLWSTVAAQFIPSVNNSLTVYVPGWRFTNEKKPFASVTVSTVSIVPLPSTSPFNSIVTPAIGVSVPSNT